MSEVVRTLVDALKGAKDVVQAIAPGLGDIVPEVSAEVARLNTQASNELASAIFTGSAFVQYGAGQYTPEVSNEQEQGRGR